MRTNTIWSRKNKSTARRCFVLGATDGQAYQPGTFLSISRPTLPAAISRSAVTAGLLRLSMRGVWPWLNMRAR